MGTRDAIGWSNKRTLNHVLRELNSSLRRHNSRCEPESSILGIGKPIATPSQMSPTTPTDLFHQGQPELLASSFNKPLLTPDTPLVGPWYKNSLDALDILIG